MDALYLALSAGGGCIAAALLGWFKSGDKFNARIFGASVVRAALAGAGFAIGTTLATGVASVENLIAAFLAGAGVDVLGHRLAGNS